MPITTFLHEHEQGYDDPEITPLLQELWDKRHERWLVTRHELPLVRRWYDPWRAFRPMLPRVTYTLYKHIAMTEWQIINFYRDNSPWTINPDVSKELIVAYLYGALGRAEHCMQENTP